MSSPNDSREAARQRAQNYFTQSERRDALVREEIEAERAAAAAKTAKLRSLRLAKEAAEAAEAAKNPVPEKKTTARRTRKIKV